MAHYAFVNDDNIVVKVITGRDEDDLIDGVDSWEEYYGALTGQRCLQTSYNTVNGAHVHGGTPFRGNYAGIGFTYDEELDAFIPPKLYDSWVFNSDIFNWEPPKPMPNDDMWWVWDEDAGDWVAVETSEA